MISEDGGTQTFTGWATGISPGSPTEASQVLDFQVTNDQTALFSVQPWVAANGTLTFTTSADAFGTAKVTVRLHNSGGTANGGVDTSAPQTFMITVQSVNDAPTLDAIGNQTINEDSDWLVLPLTGITAGAANESGQTLTVTARSSNTAVVPDGEVYDLTMDGTGKLRFLGMHIIPLTAASCDWPSCAAQPVVQNVGQGESSAYPDCDLSRWRTPTAW